MKTKFSVRSEVIMVRIKKRNVKIEVMKEKKNVQ